MPHCVVGPSGQREVCYENLEVIISYCKTEASLTEKIIFGLSLREEGEMEYVLEEKLSKWRG